MSEDLRELYQEVIVDHHRRPRNRGALVPASSKAEGHNPLCGDHLTVYVDVRDGTVAAIAFEGDGCAISTASASMMTEALEGKSVAEAEALFERFQALVTTAEGAPPAGLEGELGELAVLGGVRDHPVRIKCATLPWHTAMAALREAGEPVSTE